MIAKTPPPPYFAVIFTSLRTAVTEGYEGTAARMVELAGQVPGYLGHESFRDVEGYGVTISYWDSEAAIRRWKQQEEHLIAQAEGRNRWYEAYKMRICRVERDYEWGKVKR